MTKKAVVASERELISNPRSRSAKLRAIALWKKNEQIQ
jgi:16S rRNA C1402 N4-methylase RsmH